MTGRMACMPCAAGTAKEFPGNDPAACVACPMGMTSPAGSTVCAPAAPASSAAVAAGLYPSCASGQIYVSGFLSGYNGAYALSSVDSPPGHGVLTYRLSSTAWLIFSAAAGTWTFAPYVAGNPFTMSVDSLRPPHLWTSAVEWTAASFPTARATCTCSAGENATASACTCPAGQSPAAGSGVCVPSSTGCASGYTMVGTCVDIDECALGSSGCSHGCNNTAGGFKCTCPAGWGLQVAPGLTKVCAPCTDGQYVDAASGACMACPAGLTRAGMASSGGSGAAAMCGCPYGFVVGAAGTCSRPAYVWVDSGAPSFGGSSSSGSMVSTSAPFRGRYAACSGAPARTLAWQLVEALPGASEPADPLFLVYTQTQSQSLAPSTGGGMWALQAKTVAATTADGVRSPRYAYIASTAISRDASWPLSVAYGASDAPASVGTALTGMLPAGTQTWAAFFPWPVSFAPAPLSVNASLTAAAAESALPLCGTVTAANAGSVAGADGASTLGGGSALVSPSTTPSASPSGLPPGVSPSNSASRSPSSPATLSVTGTPAATATRSSSVAASLSVTGTSAATATRSPSAPASLSVTGTAAATATRSSSVRASPSFTATPSRTVSISRSSTATPTRVTRSPTPSASASLPSFARLILSPTASAPSSASSKVALSVAVSFNMSASLAAAQSDVFATALAATVALSDSGAAASATLAAALRALGRSIAAALAAARPLPSTSSVLEWEALTAWGLTSGDSSAASGMRARMLQAPATTVCDPVAELAAAGAGAGATAAAAAACPLTGVNFSFALHDVVPLEAGLSASDAVALYTAWAAAASSSGADLRAAAASALGTGGLSGGAFVDAASPDAGASAALAAALATGIALEAAPAAPVGTAELSAPPPGSDSNGDGNGNTGSGSGGPSVAAIAGGVGAAAFVLLALGLVAAIAVRRQRSAATVLLSNPAGSSKRSPGRNGAGSARRTHGSAHHSTVNPVLRAMPASGQGALGRLPMQAQSQAPAPHPVAPNTADAVPSGSALRLGMGVGVGRTGLGQGGIGAALPVSAHSSAHWQQPQSSSPPLPSLQAAAASPNAARPSLAGAAADGSYRNIATGSGTTTVRQVRPSAAATAVPDGAAVSGGYDPEPISNHGY